MKSRCLISLAATTLFAALAIPAPLTAQNNQNHKYHHYKLIDVGTFGGPASSVNETVLFVNGNGGINHQGWITGGSETSQSTSPTSNPLICGASNVLHAYELRNGSISDLGTLPGSGNCSGPGTINAKGEVVGGSENGTVDPLTGINEVRAVRWQNGEITDLGTFGGYYSQAGGVNNKGDIVGGSSNTVADPYSIYYSFLGSTNGTQTRAFLWRKGTMQDLGTLGGPDAAASLINDSGQIAGMSYTNYNPSVGCPGFLTSDPFFWENGKMVDLGTFGGTCGFPLAMNNHGQVVGQSNLAGDTASHAFFWDAGTGMIDLGTLGGSCSTANSVNEAAVAVGVSCIAGDQAVNAFLWAHGAMTNLGTLSGDQCSSGNSINASQQVTGTSLTCDDVTRRAFLWENGAMVDLNTLVPPDSTLQLTYSDAINDRGEITGTGTPEGCQRAEQCGHAFLLIPCDGNHPGIAGCDYSMVDARAVVAQTSPAVRNESSRTLPPSLMRQIGRYRFPGMAFGPRN